MPQPYRAPWDEGGPKLLLYAPALLACSLSVLALLSSPLSCARPFVPSWQESCAYYQLARLCWPPAAMAFIALRLPTCTGVLMPGVEVPRV